MDPILVDAAFFPQEMRAFCMNKGNFSHQLGLDLCLWKLGDLFTQGDFMTQDIGIEAHTFNWRACSRRAVVDFQGFF